MFVLVFVWLFFFFGQQEFRFLDPSKDRFDQPAVRFWFCADFFLILVLVVLICFDCINSSELLLRNTTLFREYIYIRIF